MTEAPPVTVQLLVAPGADPESDLSALDPGEWVDWSDRLTGPVSWQVGRLGIASISDPSELNLVLNNDDGYLTPGNNRSPWYPYIDKRSPIPMRLLAGLDGDEPVEQVTCFLKSLIVNVDAAGDYSTVTIKAKGRLDWLDRIDAPVITATTGTLVPTNPVAYWPLTDASGATFAASGLAGGSPMTKTGSLHFGTGNGGPGQPNILDLAYYTSTPGKLTGTVPAGTSETSWRVECKLTWPSGEDGAEGVLGWSTQGTIGFWQIGYEGATSQLRLEYWPADGSSSTRVNSVTNLTPADNTARLYRVTADQSGANIAVVVSIDGVTAISTSVSTATLGRVTKMYVNPAYNNGAQLPAIGAVTVWAPYSSSVNTVAAASGYDGETVADRLERLFAEAGLPIIIGDGGTVAMGVQQGGTFADNVRQCEAADAGLLHDGGPYGAIVFQPRRSRYNRAPDLTLSIVVDHQIADGFTGTMDDRDTLKSLTVTTTDGNSGTYEDPDVRGGSRGSVMLNLATTEDPTQHAAWRVATSNTPEMVHDALPLGDLAVENDILATWQATERIGLRCKVVDLPDQYSPRPLEVFADGYVASTDGEYFRVALAAVPADPYGVMILTTSAATLSAAVDSDDTTWTSVVSAPPRWTTTDVPLALTCGGEDPIVANPIADVAITYVSQNSVTHANNASLSPTLPASMVAGDLILLFAAIRGTSATVDVPAGYTRLAGWHNVALLGKIHTGSESAPTVSFTGGAAGDTTSCAMFAVRNTVSNINNVLVGWSDWASPASSSAVAYPPLLRPKYDGCILFYFVQQAAAWSSLATLSGFSEVLDSASALGNDQSVAGGYVIQTSATAVASSTLAITGGASGVSRALLVAIAPGKSTLTVTRATNGTAVSHSAGDQITVSAPGRLAL
jgi:hypothetical protein